MMMIHGNKTQIRTAFFHGFGYKKTGILGMG